VIEVLLNKILIKPDDIEKVSEGGIIIAQTDSYIRSEKAATTTGIIIDIGPAAWLDPILGGVPACKVGDKVLYSKYSGKLAKFEEIEYVVINDDAIQARIVE